MRKTLVVASVLLAAAGSASGQLMVVESTSDKVMLFDDFDGSLITTNFIDLTVSGASTPINAVRVGKEIWVTDQLNDIIMRWSADGTTHLGNISGGMDNIRGMEVVGNTAYISNAGTANGAPGTAVLTLDVPSLSLTGFFRVGPASSGDPFDVLDVASGLLVNDIAGENIEAHQYDGVFISTFHNSDGVSGIDFPEQMNLSAAGTVLVAGFSSPIGIYEYNSAGTQINFWAVGTGNRGVWQLGNGNIMFTDGGGVHILNPSTGGVSTVVSGVSARYIEPIPTPGTLATLLLAGALAARRRR